LIFEQGRLNNLSERHGQRMSSILTLVVAPVA